MSIGWLSIILIISNGVKQSGILSAALFNIDMNELILLWLYDSWNIDVNGMAFIELPSNLLHHFPN